MVAPRVRFCPAPSGWLHVGGARTALYNWLHARQGGGTFVFRIEDTDAERATDESMRGMIAAMRWLGLDWDEGPEVDGPHGPYQQSQRGPLYSAAAAALLQLGDVYDAYETPEELTAQREAAMRDGRPPGYAGGHRNLTPEQRAAYLEEGRRAVLRVRTPDDGVVSFVDAVRGPVDFEWKDVPDFVIERADGTHTYYLANAVDDLAMGINLIARGEDLLSATPRQLLLYDLLTRDGVIDRILADNAYPARPADAQPPSFAHLPLLVGEDRKPLSKRHGSVAVDEFRRHGFLPEVLINFLALCGWSYDATTERMTVDELVERFSFDRVGKNPSFFDTAKLRSMNGDGIKELSDTELAERLQPHFSDEGLVADLPSPEHQQLLLGLAPLLRERIQTLAEAVPLAAPYFRDEVVWDDKAVSKNLKGRAGEVLDAAAVVLDDVAWDAAAIEAALRDLAERLGLGLGRVMQPVRVAVAGTAVSTPLPQTLALLDRGLVVRRVREATAKVAA
ncbi:MAG: glutamate--tRNA ligase [Nitriliruptorales bacterium]|nr:glutamate--tRNA ligase [Nitriliruptorales bacterium]